EGDLLKVYLLARFAGAPFALAAVPEDFPEEDNLSFDPQVMRKLFEQGRRSGADRGSWRSLPPGLTPQEHLPPRSGTTFTVQEEGPPDPVTSAPVSDAAIQRLFERVREDVKRDRGP